MNQQKPLDTVLQELKLLHETHPDVAAFCPFPNDVTPQPVDRFQIPASDLLQEQVGLDSLPYPVLRDALISLAPDMHWRETYKDTDIGADFMDRFGCYEIIGNAAPFASQRMRSFLVYQPPYLHYPWHHHPADEIYVVLAGQAEFHLKGQPSETLTPGQAAFHPSGTPHALTSHAHPVMAYVVWRADFDVGPIWSET